jgi:hypothetical protein
MVRPFFAAAMTLALVGIAKAETYNILGSRLIKSTIQGRQRGKRRPGNLARACRSGLRRV